MAFKPNEITKQHIILAVEKIEKENIELIPSTKFLVEINGKQYPPKEIMRYAHQQLNGELYWEYGGGEPTNKHLKKFGFQILRKTEDPVIDLIQKYKEHVRENGLAGELYKWQLLHQFKGRPDINSNNFQEELKSIKFSNLIYPLGLGRMNHIAKERSQKYKQIFQVLFDEKQSIGERVKYFIDETYRVYREIEPDEKYPHHHDERTTSTLLTFHNPDKYTFFKNSFYQKYCKLIGVKAKDKGDKLVHYLELIDDLISEYILEDQELLNIISNSLGQDCFQDSNHKILAQDILYQTLDKKPNLNGVVALMASDGTGWQDGYIKDLENYEACVIWNSKRPSGTNETLKFLRAIIDEGSTFNLYYCSGGKVHYKATIIDFVENQKQLDDKEWDVSVNPLMNYNKIFSDYTDDNKKASIVFLAQSFTKIKPISVYDFKFYGGYDVPRQDNLSPISFEPISENDKTVSSDSKKDIISPPRASLNQILFGPPGTGKTYNTVNKAIAIANPEFNLALPRAEIKKEFERLVNEEQVVFATFHQSMSYEDFIEGIKPIDNNGNIFYETLPGIFKRICSRASIKVETNFADAYNRFIKSIGDSGESDFQLKTKTGRPYWTSVNSNGNLNILTTEEKNFQGTMTKEKLERFASGENTFVGWEGYASGVIKHLKEKFQLSEKSNESKKKNFVLIIDEINRGNVSQIFGELITLIEEDKRAGKNEALQVVLPYSKEQFSVPSNLYIIGTMNTADRSVEAIDTALRRRFSFEEIPPRYDLKEMKYEIAGYKGCEILRTINARIEMLLDKDHMIGHSYFMLQLEEDPAEKLLQSFYKNIVPLLQEYFYGDFGKIGLVLGNGFIRRKTWDKDLDSFADFDHESSAEFEERDVYEIIDYRDPDIVHTISFKNKELEMTFETAIQLLMKVKFE